MNWRDEISKLALDLGIEHPKHLAILSGAGVSQEHPTHSPSGVALMRKAIEDFFLPGTLEEMQQTYAGIRAATGEPEDLFWGRPRLEAVLEVVNEEYGAAALAHLTPFFADRTPNRVHSLLASHAALGGQQCTANFDRFIEHAGPSVVHVEHFHGEVERAADALPFGATLGKIEHGFDSHQRARFFAKLLATDVRCIAFIGYSFSDYFDVTPAMVDEIRAGAFDGRSLLWFDFQGGLNSPQVAHVESGEIPVILSAARGRGLPVRAIRGWSGDALFELLKSIGCTPDEALATIAPCDGSDLIEVGPYPIHEGRRRAATLRLLARFGMLGRIRRTQLSLSPSDMPSNFLAEYWWKLGKYESARRAALAGIAGEATDQDIHELLVNARFDWIEGRLWSAGKRIARALRAIHERGAKGELEAEALMRYGRIAVAMHRSPDTRILLLPWFIRQAPNFEEQAGLSLRSTDTGAGLAAHLSDSLRSFRREVVGQTQSVLTLVEERAALIEQFSQSESIDAYVNYIRGSANLGVIELPGDRNWRGSMMTLYQAVGDVADQNRLILLEPPGYFRRWPSAAKAAFSLEISNYQRLRMLVLHVLRRTSRSFKGKRYRFRPRPRTRRD